MCHKTKPNQIQGNSHFIYNLTILALNEHKLIESDHKFLISCLFSHIQNKNLSTRSINDCITPGNGYCKCIMTSKTESKHFFFLNHKLHTKNEDERPM